MRTSLTYRQTYRQILNSWLNDLWLLERKRFDVFCILYNYLVDYCTSCPIKTEKKIKKNQSLIFFGCAIMTVFISLIIFFCAELFCIISLHHTFLNLIIYVLFFFKNKLSYNLLQILIHYFILKLWFFLVRLPRVLQFYLQHQ